MDLTEKGVIFKQAQFRKFKHRYMNFLIWLNSFEYILEMSNIGDDEKVKYLLHMLEPSFLAKIKIISPSDPSELQYHQLITLSLNYFGYRGTEVTNYRYLYRKQLPYEPVEHYVLALRELYSKCTPFIKNSVELKNQFIAGLSDKETKTLLEKDKNISLDTAVAIAKQRELTENQKSGESSSK